MVGQHTWGPKGQGLEPEPLHIYIYSDLFPGWQIANVIMKPQVP